MHKKTLIILGTLILIVSSITIFYTNKESTAQVIQTEKIIEPKILTPKPSEPKEPTKQPKPTIPKTPQTTTITTTQLSTHNTKQDCWITYNNKVYNYSSAPFHPNMAKTFYNHCGQLSTFQKSATATHPQSSETRVANYGTYIGNLA